MTLHREQTIGRDHMNSCPLCHRTYEDESMKFCLDDGTALLQTSVVTDPNATLVLPTPRRGEPGPTVDNPQTPTFAERPMRTQADQGFHTAERSRKSPLPWILGIVIVLGISAVGVAFIVTTYLTRESQRAGQVIPVTSSPAPVDRKTAESPSNSPATSSHSP